MTGHESRCERVGDSIARHLAGPAVTPGEVFDLLPDAVVMIDDTGRMVFASAAFPRVLGHEPSELVGKDLGVFIPERFREGHERKVVAFRRGGQPAVMNDRPVLLALHRTGDEVPVSISIANLEMSGERLSVAVIRDARPVRDRLGEATMRAGSDSLTGLGNRLHLKRRIESTTESVRTFGVLFLDLARFKPFNGRYGHAVGDEVLRLVGRRLRAPVRCEETAVRLDGDEFVRVFDGLCDARDLEARAWGSDRSD